MFVVKNFFKDTARLEEGEAYLSLTSKEGIVSEEPDESIIFVLFGDIT